MIVEALISFVVGFVEFVVGLIPTTGVPGWMTNASGYLSDLWGHAAGLGAWIPWTLLGTVVSFVLASVVLGFSIKVIRIVASFFTAGGGSAA